MDSYLTALISYKNRKYEECAAVCTKILNREPHDQVINIINACYICFNFYSTLFQAAWVLKMRALNASARVDELEVDLGEAPGSEFSEAAIASLPRPGTSLQNPSSNPALNQELRSNVNMSDDRTLRPTDPSGRPLSAYVRPATSSGAASGGGRLRTAHTARPAGTATGRFIRLGTASMVAGEGEFISVSRLNYSSYAKRDTLARQLFEHLYFALNDVRHVSHYIKLLICNALHFISSVI